MTSDSSRSIGYLGSYTEPPPVLTGYFTTPNTNDPSAVVTYVAVDALLSEANVMAALAEFSWDAEHKPHPLDFRDWVRALVDQTTGKD